LIGTGAPSCTGCAVPTPRSSHIGHYVMVTAEHREPCDSRGSCTVLGAPGGEIPPGDSSFSTELGCPRHVRFTPIRDRIADVPDRQLRARSGSRRSLNHLVAPVAARCTCFDAVWRVG
jgi:hypothetical protein